MENPYCPKCGKRFEIDMTQSHPIGAMVYLPHVCKPGDTNESNQVCKCGATLAEHGTETSARSSLACPRFTPATDTSDDCFGNREEMIARYKALGEEYKKILAAAKRLLDGGYHPWAESGGGEECAHGINKAIPCFRCDQQLIRDAQ